MDERQINMITLADYEKEHVATFRDKLLKKIKWKLRIADYQEKPCNLYGMR